MSTPKPRKPVLLDHLGNEVRLSTRPGVQTTIRRENGTTRVWNQYAIPNSFLDGLRARRNDAPTRAPLGDSRTVDHKVAEIPLALVMQKLRPEEWEDPKAWARLLNDRDFSVFRVDAEGRTF